MKRDKNDYKLLWILCLYKICINESYSRYGYTLQAKSDNKDKLYAIN